MRGALQSPQELLMPWFVDEKRHMHRNPDGDLRLPLFNGGCRCVKRYAYAGVRRGGRRRGVSFGAGPQFLPGMVTVMRSSFHSCQVLSMPWFVDVERNLHRNPNGELCSPFFNGGDRCAKRYTYAGVRRGGGEEVTVLVRCHSSNMTRRR